jgi:outer membrane protein OmpA-like peptidoglycan-associated protein
MNKLTQPLPFSLLSSVFVLLCTLSFSLVASVDLPAKYLDEIVALQRRADTLAFGKIGSNNYHLAKSRTWLGFATSEYHEGDDSGVMQAAVVQAEAIISALENNQTPAEVNSPTDMPSYEKIRPDLWEKVTVIKHTTNNQCGQRQLAEGEVQLVWAGHEKVESGWSHAEPYVRIAENAISEAQTAIRVCNEAITAAPAAIVPTPVIAKPVAAPIIPATETITLSGDALFAFNRATLNPSALPKLDELVDKIKRVKAYDEIVLVGHTDRLRSDGHPERNQTLSEDRAETVKQYLAGKGVDANKMHASGAGSSQPVVQCNDSKMNKTQLAACLQPNRRVEIIFHGVR